jgi:hypothetical protein
MKKLGPQETIANAEKERKGETAKIQGKMQIFLRDVQNVQISCGLERIEERRETKMAMLCCLIPNESRRRADECSVERTRIGAGNCGCDKGYTESGGRHIFAAGARERYEI